MYKSWSKARKELFPKIHKNINKGKIRTAKTMLKNLNANMGMNHKYPYATKDPRYIALNDNLKRMQKKYNQDYNESMKKIGIYKKEKHLKPAIKLTETLLNNWQHHPQITGDMQRSIISLKKLLALAINHDKRGDLASSKYKDYKEAIRQYKASLYHNNDSRVQRKLDEAIKMRKQVLITKTAKVTKRLSQAVEKGQVLLITSEQIQLIHLIIRVMFLRVDIGNWLKLKVIPEENVIPKRDTIPIIETLFQEKKGQ